MNHKNYVCNVCGKKLDAYDIQNDLSLCKTIGYGSIHDGSRLALMFCCDCMDALITGCKVSPVSEEAPVYDAFDREISSLDMDVIIAEECECVSHAHVYGLENSIRRAKFPMSVDTDIPNSDLTAGISALAKSNPGEGHDQWLTGVIVQFDLTFSNKAWVEAERYHFFDFVSSQSTMHRIARFDLDSLYNEYADPRIVDIMKEKLEAYNNETNEDERAKKYLELLYSNPAGCKITAGMTTNYRQLKTIYRQRKNHRLPEWREFCHWIEKLPMSELITGDTTE